MNSGLGAMSPQQTLRGVGQRIQQGQSLLGLGKGQQHCCQLKTSRCPIRLQL